MPSRPAPYLAAAAAACYAVHLVALGQIDKWSHGLWMCHLASLLIAVGCVRGRPTWVACGVLWTGFGTPLWVFQTIRAPNWFMPTSVLTHVVCPVLGLMALRRMGWPRHAWWKATLGIVVLQPPTWWLTPADQNINFAFRIQSGFEAMFAHSHLLFLVVSIGTCAALFLSLETAGRRLTGAAETPGIA